MTTRAGILAVLDHACDGPRRIEHAIAAPSEPGCCCCGSGGGSVGHDTLGSRNP